MDGARAHSSRAAAAVPSGGAEAMEDARARQAFRRARESTPSQCRMHACSERAPGVKTQNERAAPLPGLGATWHGVVSKAKNHACMGRESALQAVLLMVLRACIAAARRPIHGGACMHRRGGRVEPLLFSPVLGGITGVLADVRKVELFGAQ